MGRRREEGERDGKEEELRPHKEGWVVGSWLDAVWRTDGQIWGQIGGGGWLLHDAVYFLEVDGCLLGKEGGMFQWRRISVVRRWDEG